MATGPRATLRRLGLSALSLAVSLALAELGARALGVDAHRARGPRSLENAAKTRAIDAYPTNPRGDFPLDLRDGPTRASLARDGVPGLDRAARDTPHAVDFAYNPERCRSGPVGPRAPGVARVVVLGDSFTEGQGVAEPMTFARGIERTLRARGRSVEVINCGRRGSDFPFLFERFESLVERYAPDVVLYAMVLNDAEQSPVFRARQSYLNDWILDRRRALGDDEPEGPGPWWRSRLWDFSRDRYDALRVARETSRWYVEMYGPPNAPGWSRTQAHLQRMSAAMRARGGVFTVALLPLLVATDARYPFDAPSREIARACRAAVIPFDDALAALAGAPAASLWVHPLDMHPNALAHARLAARLAPRVEDALNALSPRPPR